MTLAAGVPGTSASVAVMEMTLVLMVVVSRGVAMYDVWEMGDQRGGGGGKATW